MTSSLPGRPTASARIATRTLLLVCLFGAVAAAVVSVTVSIQSVAARVPSVPHGFIVTISEPMVAVSPGTTVSAPLFQPSGLTPSAVITTCIIAIVLCALVAMLSLRLLMRRPFARAVSIALIVGGCAVAVAAGVPLLAGFTAPSSALTTAFIIAGLLLVIVGLVAERGAALQNDTEGLV